MTFDIAAHLRRQKEFSERAFGPMVGQPRRGVLDHIRKELDEVEKDWQAGVRSDEWVDVVILAFDGFLREGYSVEEILTLWEAKQTKNEKREWPDWRTADPDKAIEHVRGIHD